MSVEPDPNKRMARGRQGLLLEALFGHNLVLKVRALSSIPQHALAPTRKGLGRDLSREGPAEGPVCLSPYVVLESRSPPEPLQKPPRRDTGLGDQYIPHN